MYYLTEDVGDYAIDAPPTDFEPVEENVLIVQQRDEDLKTLDEGLVALEQAFNDLQTLTQVNTIVRECIANGQVPAGVHHRAVELNRQLAKRYPDQTVVTEAVRHGHGVMVMLKAEEEDQRGFFVKIWDAICKAFGWVWEKIASLFSTGPEKTEEKAKEADKAAEALKDVPKEEIDLEKLKPALLKISGVCRHGDEQLTVAKLLEWPNKIETNLTAIVGLLGGLNDSYQSWSDFAKKVTAQTTKDEYVASFKQISGKLAGAVGHLTAISDEQALKYNPTFSTATYRNKAHGLLGLGKDQALVVREHSPAYKALVGDDAITYSTFFHRKDEKPVSKPMAEAPVGEQATRLADAAERLAKIYSNSAETFMKVAKRQAERTNELKKAGELNLSGGEWDAEAEKLAKDVLVDLGQSISSMMVGAGAAAKNIQASIDAISAFVIAVHAAVKKDTQEPPKEGS